MRNRSMCFLVLALSLAVFSSAFAADQDGDGVDDTADNCLLLPNRAQLDADGDGYGNRCDVDFDQSGLADGRDVRFFTRAIRKQSPAADINEDGRVDWNDPIAAIELWGLPPGPGPVPADDDGDGVPLLEDACPDSIGSGASVYPGCSHADLSLEAARLIGAPAARELRRTFSAFELLPPEFDTFSGIVEFAATELEQAARMLQKGAACDGAGVADRTAAVLERVRDELADEVALAAGVLGRSVDRPGGTPGVDWQDTSEFFQVMLPYRLSEKQYDNGLASAIRAAAEMQSVCDSETGPQELNGTVSYYNPTARVLEFDFGAVVAVADEFHLDHDLLGNAVSLGAGMEVEAQGNGFSDGSVLVTQVTPLEERAVEFFQDSHCADLQIAPYQIPTSYSGQPQVIHDARSYRRTGVSTLSLEPGMAIGVSTVGCPQADSHALRAVYGARIVVTVGGVVLKLAEFYKHEWMVDLAEGIPAFSEIEIAVTTRREDCLLNDLETCTATRDLGTTIWTGIMRPRGFYCEVEYEETEFRLEDASPAAFAVTRPNFLTVFDGPGRDNPTSHFVGLGWRVRNGTHGDQVEEVRMLEDFAVFPGDFRDPWEAKRNWIGDTNEVLGLARDPLGIPVRSALIWPSLRGTQNGGPFRYSCRLPRVSRDVVGFCSDHGNAFWEFPLDGAMVGQGPNGSFSHTADEAWDLGADTGAPVYAARAGTVFLARGTEGDTCDPDVDSPGDPQCAGNWVGLVHSDGSISTYGHLQQGQVFVEEGDRVRRGRLLAFSGNTGYSTGPHLHFETSDGLTGNAEDAWFHLLKLVIGSSLEDLSCYEPATGDFILQAP